MVVARRDLTGRPPICAAILAAVLSIAGAWSFAAPAAGSTAKAARSAVNSADRLIIWTGCRDFVELTDAELGMWKSRGVDGFACVVGHLKGMGGTQNFTSNRRAALRASEYGFQRRLRDSRVVRRAAARGIEAYLGAYLVNYYNPATPLKRWFDNAGWSRTVLPRVRDLASAAKRLGFAGLAFDQELYRQHSGTTATWSWNYAGNRRAQRQVRGKVEQRGRELMKTIVGAFPRVRLLVYDTQFPQTWGELVQEKVNGARHAFASRVDIDFWDGLSSVEGYGAIRLIDATFYKTPHLATWDTALQYHYNRLYSYLSRRLSNWEYASSRFFVSPFAWIDGGPCSCLFDDPRPPEYVAEQLSAFRKWGMGGAFANYAYAGLRGFDYSPYVEAMRSGSTPAVVDAEAPGLTIAGPPAASDAARSIALRGTATDNLAIRAVRWRNRRGGAGVARLTWHVRSGDYRSGYIWESRWSIPAVALKPGKNRISITAEDIKGLTTTKRLKVGHRR